MASQVRKLGQQHGSISDVRDTELQAATPGHSTRIRTILALHGHHAPDLVPEHTRHRGAHSCRERGRVPGTDATCPSGTGMRAQCSPRQQGYPSRPQSQSYRAATKYSICMRTWRAHTQIPDSRQSPPASLRDLQETWLGSCSTRTTRMRIASSLSESCH